MPVPIAVAPRLISRSSPRVSWMRASSSARVAPHAANSCPTVIGTASCSWVRPTFGTDQNSRDFSLQASARHVDGGGQAVERREQAQLHRRRIDVVGALAPVHVVERMHLVVACRQAGPGARARGWRRPRWRSCSSRCRRHPGSRRRRTGRRAGRRARPGRPGRWRRRGARRSGRDRGWRARRPASPRRGRPPARGARRRACRRRRSSRAHEPCGRPSSCPRGSPAPPGSRVRLGPAAASSPCSRRQIRPVTTGRGCSPHARRARPGWWRG